MQTYIEKVCKGHKGKDGEVYRLRAFIADSTGELAKLLAKDKAARKNNEPSVWANGRERPKRTPIEHLEWVQRPLALVQASDINEYVEARCESVDESTVDREIDVLSQVFTMAITYWGYNVGTNPMLGVLRPKFFNERNRRLVGDEEARILAAARAEDRLRSIELEVERLLEPYLEQSLALPSKSARKKFLAAAKKEVRPAAAKSYTHVALYETLIEFLLATAARRGEALSLSPSNVNLEAQTAYLPETKNGLPRTLPLVSTLVESLRKLLDQSEDDEYVFPISVDDLKNVWERICACTKIEDLHVHDLRHEGISRVADTGKCSLVDLQAFSGHRDPRSLLRYAHLCATKLAHRLDEAFRLENMTYDHKGRKRLKGGAPVSMGDLMRDTSQIDDMHDLLRQIHKKLDDRSLQATNAEGTDLPMPEPGRAIH
jgi:integrase